MISLSILVGIIVLALSIYLTVSFIRLVNNTDVIINKLNNIIRSQNRTSECGVETTETVRKEQPNDTTLLRALVKMFKDKYGSFDECESMYLGATSCEKLNIAMDGALLSQLNELQSRGYIVCETVDKLPVGFISLTEKCKPFF